MSVFKIFDVLKFESSFNIVLYLGQESNSTEKVCDSYVRVNMKPTMERLHYGLCEKSKSAFCLSIYMFMNFKTVNKYYIHFTVVGTSP